MTSFVRHGLGTAASKIHKYGTVVFFVEESKDCILGVLYFNIMKNEKSKNAYSNFRETGSSVNTMLNHLKISQCTFLLHTLTYVL